jgi:hypothetical protein
MMHELFSSILLRAWGGFPALGALTWETSVGTSITLWMPRGDKDVAFCFIRMMRTQLLSVCHYLMKCKRWRGSIMYGT